VGLGVMTGPHKRGADTNDMRAGGRAGAGAVGRGNMRGWISERDATHLVADVPSQEGRVDVGAIVARVHNVHQDLCTQQEEWEVHVTGCGGVC